MTWLWAYSHFGISFETAACQHNLLTKNLGQETTGFANFDPLNGTIFVCQKFLGICLPYNFHIRERSDVFK